MQGLDQPECAEIEGRLGLAEIIWQGVTKHDLPAPQAFFDRRHSGQHPRVGWRAIAHIDELEQTGVEFVTAEGRGVASKLFVPRFALDRGANMGRAAIPKLRTIPKPQLVGCISKAIASGPAHDGRIGMDRFTPAKFPKARIGLVMEFEGSIADGLQGYEILD